MATKCDQRDSNDNNRHGYITSRDGELLSKEINADGFYECSTLNRDNIDAVFEEAIKIVIELKKIKKSKCCLS